MRVLLTVHQFLPEYSTGTEVIAHDLAEELQRNGHEVAVVTGCPRAPHVHEPPSCEHYTYGSVPVYRLRGVLPARPDGSSLLQLDYRNPSSLQLFTRILDRFAPDVVHFLHLQRLSASIIDACAARSIPTVFTATDFWAICPLNQLRLPDDTACEGPDDDGVNCVRHFAHQRRTEGRGRIRALAAGVLSLPDAALRPLVRASRGRLGSTSATMRDVRALAERPGYLRTELGRVERVVAPSAIMERVLIAGGIAADRVVAVPYGVRTERIVRNVRRGADPVLRLGFFGSIALHKGADVLLHAMAGMEADLPVTLEFFGALPIESAMTRQLASAMRADSRIRYRGGYRNDTVGRILARIDALVVPSVWHENTPMVIYEAFSAGVPVVASDVAGISTVVRHEVNGLLFPRSDAVALRGCLTRLSHDRGLVARLAEGTVVPQHVSAFAMRMAQIYDEVRQGNPSRE